MGGMTVAPTFYNFTGNKTPVTGEATAWKYGFGCANCHPTATTSHFNGYIDVAVSNGGGTDTTLPQLRKNNAATAAWNNTNKTCANIYCHGDGAVTPAGTTIAWTSTFAAAGGDRCAKCHGNSPSTAPHGAHVVGIHGDDVFDGRSGKLLTSGAKTVNATHGAGNRSTTIDCYICHNSVINVAGNDKNTYCVTCHTGTATVGTAKITSLFPHVNGVKNVQFANTKIATKAQLRPGSFESYTGATQGGWARNRAYKTYAATFANNTSAYDVTKLTLTAAGASFVGGNCSNIACHAGKPVTWNTTPLSCESCHTRL
jgi:predicted CxxxxCH...CXXCH cytochrome family protein